ncbi:hypothetical protein VQ056_01660 [Paenibacillus sp. JTLBN-2024]
MKAYGKLMLVIFAVFMLAGCGKEKPDLSIFMIDDKSDPTQVAEPLEKRCRNVWARRSRLK